jgi:hypothetical protein
MPVIDFHKKVVNFKIVYYGPGLSGKTTNIQYIHEQIKPEFKGKLVSLATQTDRTLFFDFLPMDLGEMSGYKIRLHLYTVPGQVHYNATRKLVLKGVDGVVFVADSQSTMKDANIESLLNLEKNLQSYGKSLEDIPHLIQGNKRDLDDLTPMADLESILNRYGAPVVEAVATEGPGVLDTLREVVRIVIKAARDQLPDDAGDEVIADPELDAIPAAETAVPHDTDHDPEDRVEEIEEVVEDQIHLISDEEILDESEQLDEAAVVMSEEAELISAEHETSHETSPEKSDDLGMEDSRMTDGAILDLEVPIPGGGRLELKLGVVARVLKSSSVGAGGETMQKVELTVKPLEAEIPDEGPAPVLDLDDVSEEAMELSSDAVLESVPDELTVEELTDPIDGPESGYDPSVKELEIAEPAELDTGVDTKKQKKGIFGLFKKIKK